MALPKYSKNPEDWVKKCCDCDNVLKYSTFESYRTQFNKQIRCKDCVIKTVDNKYNRPNYNKHTIPFIVDILNVRYNTEFIHAECEGGEFYVYDHVNKTRFFADAYSEELNMWFEFDEPSHFRKGILKEECQQREQRIRELIPDVIINRIYFNKKHHNSSRITK